MLVTEDKVRRSSLARSAKMDASASTVTIIRSTGRRFSYPKNGSQLTRTGRSVFKSKTMPRCDAHATPYWSATTDVKTAMQEHMQLVLSAEEVFHGSSEDEQVQASEPRTIEVHDDQAWLVDQQDNAFIAVYMKQMNIAIHQGESPVDAFQYLLYPASAIEANVKERHQSLSIHSEDEAYKALDCGLLGDNFDRKSLEPMLKVWGQDKYIRADSHFEKVFQH